jgi:hypothetical protein
MQIIKEPCSIGLENIIKKYYIDSIIRAINVIIFINLGYTTCFDP